MAVVSENKRRLALHAGFHPLPLRFVKVLPSFNQSVQHSCNEHDKNQLVFCSNLLPAGGPRQQRLGFGASRA